MSWVLWVWLATGSGKAMSAPVAVSSHATEQICEAEKHAWIEASGGRFEGRCVQRLRSVLPGDEP